MDERILVTGAAGFIGAAVCKKLVADGEKVIGIDNFNDYYDPNLKYARISNISKDLISFRKIDICDQKSIGELFREYAPSSVIHLAAQAGVRYSLENPGVYIQTNIVGFGNILECCKKYDVKHLVYASSSSVYGGNKNMPFKETQSVSHPVSLYAATKRANELMAHTYSHLYNLSSTGLRFFTVYGPWGRPDMALFKFVKNIILKKKIEIFNNGKHSRDFTYIDDIVEGVFRITKTKNSTKNIPHQIFNIGKGKSEKLMDFITEIEKNLKTKSKKKFLPMQKGDVEKTFANTTKLLKLAKYKPKVSIKQGIEKFVNWYIKYYKIKKI